MAFWTRKTRFAQVIFILIIIYCACGINVLLLTLGVINYIPVEYIQSHVFIIFSIISLVLALLVSTYHLSTMIRRRKRLCDILPEEEKPCNKILKERLASEHR